MKNIIFLLETEDKNIILNVGDMHIQPTDQLVYDEDIETLVEMEMNESRHLDYIEDYENELEFYLSNTAEDSYTEYLKDILDTVTLTKEARIIIRDEVVDRIKERV